MGTRRYGGVKRERGKTGDVTTCGRGTYGAYNATTKRAYAAGSMKIWTWTVDTNDWRGKSSSQLVSYVVNNARKGDTVLMHMQWNGFNKSTVKKIKSGLSKKGVKLCKNTGTVKAKPSKIKC